MQRHLFGKGINFILLFPTVYWLLPHGTCRKLKSYYYLFTNKWNMLNLETCGSFLGAAN